MIKFYEMPMSRQVGTISQGIIKLSRDAKDPADDLGLLWYGKLSRDAKDPADDLGLLWYGKLSRDAKVPANGQGLS